MAILLLVSVAKGLSAFFTPVTLGTLYEYDCLPKVTTLKAVTAIVENKGFEPLTCCTPI